VAFNRKILKDFDVGLVINVFLICMVGMVVISSATHVFKGGSSYSVVRQALWLVAGFGLLAATTFIDYNTYRVYYKVIYIANLVLLGLVVLLGKVTNGANSWLGILGLGIQPSEFMKISLVLVLAKKIEEFDGNINNFKNLGILALYSIIPLGLIAAQPDMGTAMVLAVIVLGMLFMAGLDLRVLIGGLAACAAAALVALFSPLPILDQYMKDRIFDFLDPARAPQHGGYQAIQSKIAVGSGQLFGMGFGNGIQNTGNFISEAQTDFIFSILGEEFGFIGAIVMIVLYASMIFRCLKVVKVAKDKFGSMVVIGVVSMFAIQMFQNIGMTIGLMPITGITLPFISYGGSSLFTSMIAIGLVLNVGMRRHKINF
jgi:rod shape-determining protein RodA